MEIITKTEGNKATMEISGWLDTQTAPQLGEALSGLEVERKYSLTTTSFAFSGTRPSNRFICALAISIICASQYT